MRRGRMSVLSVLSVWSVWSMSVSAVAGLALGGTSAHAVVPLPGDDVGASAPKLATLRPAGTWKLNDRSALASDLPSRNRVVDSLGIQNGDFPGFRSTTTVQQDQPPVYVAAGHSAYFPGWQDLTSTPCPTDPAKTCDVVVADASLARIPDRSNRLSPGTVPASGGSTSYWSVQIEVRADPLTVETTRATTWDDPSNPFGRASPNIIQQGKASAGGQWKVSQHPKRGSAQLYTVSCDFEDSSNAARTVKPRSTVFLSATVSYRVECALLRGGIPRLTVWRKGSSSPVVDERGSYPAVAYTVAPADDVYIGKKYSRSGGTASLVHANDAFAGYLDNIVIATSR